MHKATITSVSSLTGEHVHVIEDDRLSAFYARIVGTMGGIVASGAVITDLDVQEVLV